MGKKIPQSILLKITGFSYSNSLTWWNTYVHVFMERVHCRHKKVHPQAAGTEDCTEIRGTPITYLISIADSPQGQSSSFGVWAGYGMSTS